MTNFKIAWFYVVTPEAEPILQKLFDTGIQPGSVITVPAEDLEILRDGVSYFPIQVIEDKKPILIGGPYKGPRSM